MSMKFSIVCGMMLAVLPLAGYSDVPTAPTPDVVRQVEQLVQQRVKLELNTAQAQQAWQLKKQQLENEKELLKKRQQFLQKKLDRLQSATAKRSEETEELIEQRHVRADTLKQLESVVDEQRAVAARWSVQLKDVDAERAQQLNSLNGVDVDMLSRLRTLLSFYTALLKTQGSIRREPMLLTMNGRQVEAQVLLLGLSAAYALPESGPAARGRPENGTWHWIPDESLRPLLEKTFDQMDNRGEMGLAELPVER